MGAPETGAGGWTRAADGGGGWSFITQVMLPPLAGVAGLPTSLDAPGIPASVWSRYGHSQLTDEEITTGKFLSLAGRG